MTHDEEIIREATEIYETNQNGGALVGDLLRIIKSQKAEIEKKDTEIDILIRKKHALRDEVERLNLENLLMVASIKRLKTEAYREFAKKFEKKIKDVEFTLGQTWEIQCALKQMEESK